MKKESRNSKLIIMNKKISNLPISESCVTAGWLFTNLFSRSFSFIFNCGSKGSFIIIFLFFSCVVSLPFHNILNIKQIIYESVMLCVSIGTRSYIFFSYFFLLLLPSSLWDFIHIYIIREDRNKFP